jgi:hypothetical protein
MATNILDIKKLETEIALIKYPLIFLFSLEPHLDMIDDMNLSIILRIFLKYHNESVSNYNIKKIFSKSIPDYFISLGILSNFQKLLKKKIIYNTFLGKWKESYNNVKFWKLNTGDMIDYIINLKTRFDAIFDCSKSNEPFYKKLHCYINKNNKWLEKSYYDINENIIHRLELILKLIGKKIFNAVEIPVITMDEYESLDAYDIIKYMEAIYERISKFLEDSIDLFTSYNMICMQINSMINPTLVNIEIKEVESETELDEIKLYSSSNFNN